MSLPAASLLDRTGPARSILIALATMIVGCLLVQLVARYQNYELILAALFVLGVGITTLQVAANPVVAVLGPVERSHYRLTLAQAFNSLGAVLGVNFGATVMLSVDRLETGQHAITDPAQKLLSLAAVSRAFMLIALALSGLMAFIWLYRRRIEAAASNVIWKANSSVLAALRSGWAIFGAIAIGLYVGAEVSIGSIMINFLHESDVLGLPLESAGFYLANIYWMGALVGRFIGSFLLTWMAAPRLLTMAAATASVLCLTAVLGHGPVVGYAALAVGLFNSVMFPTIFTITLERAGTPHAATSGLLCLAIVGGAILPYAVGKIADDVSLSLSFLVPMAAYAVIAAFAYMAIRAPVYGKDKEISSCALS
jgi:FHS family L-fucose permease-like MFS transporter